MSAKSEFGKWSAGNAGARLTDWLRETSEPDWSAATEAPFTSALATGSLDRGLFARYLVQDYSFVDSFLALIGFTVGLAPDLEDRLTLGRFMGLVTSDENTYFRRSFEALHVPESEWRQPDLLPVTRDFHVGLVEPGRAGRFADALAVLVVTEWVYLAWARPVADAEPGEFYFREWIGLHANPGFEEFVGWLRNRLDVVGVDLEEPEFESMTAAFRDTVRLERRFFDAFDPSSKD